MDKCCREMVGEESCREVSGEVVFLEKSVVDRGVFEKSVREVL